MGQHPRNLGLWLLFVPIWVSSAISPNLEAANKRNFPTAAPDNMTMQKQEHADQRGALGLFLWASIGSVFHEEHSGEETVTRLLV